MYWLCKCCVLLLILVSKCFAFEDCTEVSAISVGMNFCFWYKRVPGDSRNQCLLQEGTDITLQCNVYMPHDESNMPVGTVIWVKQVNNDIRVMPASNFNVANVSVVGTTNFPSGLYLDKYFLTLNDISAEDEGIYWCQIEVNGVCAMRSTFLGVRIAESTNCLNHNIDHGSSPILVNDTVGCDVTSPTMPTSGVDMFTTETQSTSTLAAMSTATTQHIPTGPTMGSTDISTSSTTDEPVIEPVICDGSVSGLAICLGVVLPTVIFTLILIIMGICCAGFCLYQNRRKNRIAISGVEGDKPTVIPLDEIPTAVLPVHPYEDVGAGFDNATGQSLEPQYHEIEGIGPKTSTHTYETVMSTQGNRNAQNKLGNQKGKNNINVQEYSEAGYNQLFGENPPKTNKQEPDVHTYSTVAINERVTKANHNNMPAQTDQSGQDYSALDHSVASNTAQQATIKAVLEESVTSDERYYTTPQIRQQKASISSSQSQAQGYGHLDHNRAPGHEYHELEASPAPEYGHLEASPAPEYGHLDDKTVRHDYQELESSPAPYQVPVPSVNTSEIDTSSHQIFDDSQYSRLTTDRVKGATNKQNLKGHGLPVEPEYSVLHEGAPMKSTATVPPPRILQKTGPDPTYNKLDFSHESTDYETTVVERAPSQQNAVERRVSDNTVPAERTVDNNGSVTQQKEDVSLFDDMSDVQEVWI